MARETLDAVKNSEANAAKIESQALKEHDSILLRAEEQAKSIISTKEKEALKISNDEMERAKKLGDEMMQKSIDEGNNEKEELTKRVKSDEKRAIKHILSQIV